METIKIEFGKTCRIDAGNCGYNIAGPSLVVCIKQLATEKELRMVICKLFEESRCTIEKAMSVLADTKTDIMFSSVCKCPTEIVSLPYQTEP